MAILVFDASAGDKKSGLLLLVEQKMVKNLTNLNVLK